MNLDKMTILTAVLAIAAEMCLADNGILPTQVTKADAVMAAAQAVATNHVTAGAQVEVPDMPLSEQARAAFLSSRWDDAIALVDQLDESEADAELRYFIGYCYKEGLALDHDYTAAFWWFKSSAQMGDARAQVELGRAFEKGRGAAKNDAEAAKWYTMSAKSGNADAALLLGEMCDEGRGVLKNPVEAAKWYRVAADVHGRAAYRLGKHYEEGNGVTKSEVEALFWYRRASAFGDPEAVAALHRLRRNGKESP